MLKSSRGFVGEKMVVLWWFRLEKKAAAKFTAADMYEKGLFLRGFQKVGGFHVGNRHGEGEGVH